MKIKRTVEVEIDYRFPWKFAKFDEGAEGVELYYAIVNEQIVTFGDSYLFMDSNTSPDDYFLSRAKECSAAEFIDALDALVAKFKITILSAGDIPL